MTDKAQFAELASEYWKLLQAFERCAALAPDSSKPRLAAQARYSNEKLKALLGREGMCVVSFDGLKFEVNLPAIAVNAQDVASNQTQIVERTLEPAIVSDTEVIITGKVYLVESNSGS